MISIEQKRKALGYIIEVLELPEYAYERARNRYDDLGEWFNRSDSTVVNNNPHIFPQGSFRLGTAIRPINERCSYDLDLACKLRTAITERSNTQEQLKRLIGQEIEEYRIARGIEAYKEEKHRCWSLEYRDDLSFHMDIVPCIPARIMEQQQIQESMRIAGETEFVSRESSQLAVYITDDRHNGYRIICDDWQVSNPEGYAKWFEQRMSPSQRMIMAEAKIDDVPLFKRKTPLQRAIQILKRHRDRMFQSDDKVKPISMIITTLAARAYQKEADIESALRNILNNMGHYVSNGNHRVPNPVNPQEDFADKWSTPKYSHLNLESNFWNWLRQAKNDFDLLTSSEDIGFIAEQAEQKYFVRLSQSELKKRLGLTASSVIITTPKEHTISDSLRPWREKY